VVTARFTLLKDTLLTSPMLETTQRSRSTGGEWTMVESDEDPLAAARRAANRMVDFLVNNWQFSPEHAYLLCSVAIDPTHSSGGKRADGYCRRDVVEDVAATAEEPGD
jgi:acetamidase/formamidase